MTFHEIRHYLLSKPEAQEDFPFRLPVAVMKIQLRCLPPWRKRMGLSV